MYRRLADSESPTEIVFAGVASGGDLLCEYSRPGNMSDVVRDILRQQLATSTRASFSYEGIYLIHVLAQASYKFIAITGKDYMRKLAYEFLEELKDNYINNPNATRQRLQDTVRKYNQVQTEDKIVRIKNQLQEINALMVVNIDMVIQRGVKLDTLAEKTEEIEGVAKKFHKDAVKTERHFCWQNWKWRVIISCSCLVLVAILALVIYLFLIN